MDFRMRKSAVFLFITLLSLTSTALADISNGGRFPLDDKSRPLPPLPPEAIPGGDEVEPPAPRPRPLPVTNAMIPFILLCLQNLDGENFRMYQYYCVEKFDIDMCIQAIQNFDPDMRQRCIEEVRRNYPILTIPDPQPLRFGF